MAPIFSGKLCDVTGIPPMTLQAWISKGFLPSQGEAGPGRHRTFTLMETVALAYAFAWRKTAGADLDRLREIIAVILATDEDQFRAEMAKGRKFILPVPNPELVSFCDRCRLPDEVDLSKVYKRVVAAVKPAAPKPIRA